MQEFPYMNKIQVLNFLNSLSGSGGKIFITQI